MPIIDSSQDYESIKANNSLTVTQIGHYALKIVVNDATLNSLFSMTGGIVYFVPQGAVNTFLLYDFYPDLPPLLPGTGFLLQKIWPADTRTLNAKLPVGVPPPEHIVYLNVVPASVRTALKPFVQILPDKWLTDNPLVGDHQQHVEQYLDKILLGQAGVFVKGGTQIGKMATSEVTLFFAGNDLEGLSPILHIRNMPDYGGEQWKKHPLIEAVSTLPVPVDIYLAFSVWDNSEKVFKPLPDGVTVDILDFDLGPFDIDPPLQTKTTNEDGNGQVHFTFPNIQNIDEEEPDLFFEVHLGSHNPEPSLLDDPWSSREWVFSLLFWIHTTGDGYYDNFDGTRLGSAILPLLFRIGLGFWADLISLRPSISIQQQLRASDPSKEVLFIEDAESSENEAGPPINPNINLDYYPVRVTVFPTIGNKVFTATDLLQQVRVKINDFVDTSLFEFETGNLPAVWETANPTDLQELQQLLGTLVNINFYLAINLDDGYVVLSDIDTTRFTFSTVRSGLFDGIKHPVSGNRQVGFTPQPDGSYIFYVRGADRPTSADDDSLSSIEFRGADLGWKSLQSRIAEFVNDNGGQAFEEPSFSARFPWDSVRAQYWNPTTGRL
jgi:hypothetical protein